LCLLQGVYAHAAMVEEEPGGAHPKAQISPETLASIDKITTITLSCTKQLQVINDAMERCVVGVTDV